MKVSYKEVENDAAASDANKKKAVETLVSQYDGAEVSVALLAALIAKKISITKVENEKTLNRYIEINGNDSIDYGKFVLIQPGKGDVIHDNKTVPSYKISSPNINVNLSGDFNYNEIHIEKGNNLNIDNARFTIGDKYLLSSDAVLDLYKDINSLFGKNVNYEDIIKANADTINKNDYVFPELDFRIFDREYDENSGEQIDNKKSLNIASLFKLYTQVANNRIDKLNIKRLYNSGGDVTYDIDGRAYEKDNTTSLLFAEDGNTVKETGVPNISIETYFNLKQKYYSDISSISNFKITNKDKYTSTEDIDTTFRNVIFEDDMSGLTNSEVDQFHGVAYFKNKNYTIKNEKQYPSSKGVLKLDDLSNTENINISSTVIDFRNVDKTKFEEYNNSNETDKKFINSTVFGLYAPKDVFTNKTEKDILNIGHKFVGDENSISHIFSGNNEGVYNSNNLIHSKTPRSLEEFEYYGNNEEFKKSAYDTYENDFKDKDSSILLKDKNGTLEAYEGKKNQIALNNRRVSASFYA